MFSSGFAYLCLGYFTVRATTISEFKARGIAMMFRFIGITYCLLGAGKLALDYGLLPQDTFLKYKVFYLGLIFIIGGTVITLILDSKRRYSLEETSFASNSQVTGKRESVKATLQLITWDMWLVTGIGIFLFLYPVISLFLSPEMCILCPFMR